MQICKRPRGVMGVDSCCDCSRCERAKNIAHHGRYEEFYQRKKNYTMMDSHQSRRLKLEQSQ